MTSKKTLTSTFTLAATTLAGGMALAGVASADVNPFGMTSLSSGYQVAMEEGKCGDMKGAAEKMKDGKCGAGKCGANMKEKAEKMKDGKCGAGKCGGNMKEKAEKMKDGKCGAGKCGAKK